MYASKSELPLPKSRLPSRVQLLSSVYGSQPVGPKGSIGGGGGGSGNGGGGNAAARARDPALEAALATLEARVNGGTADLRHAPEPHRPRTARVS